MQNQTDSAWLEGLEPDALGTGVVLEYNDSGGTEKVFIQDVTYNQCIERSREATAFKWVPHSVASYEEVTGTTCKR